MALALGYGSLYNHSYQPNARYDDESGQTKVFTAIRDIEAGEEITVNYNGEPEDESPVGFEVVMGKESRQQPKRPKAQHRCNEGRPTTETHIGISRWFILTCQRKAKRRAWVRATSPKMIPEMSKNACWLVIGVSLVPGTVYVSW